jgi:acetyl esterase
MRIPIFILISVLALASVANGAERKQQKGQPYQPELPNAKSEIYKRVGETELLLFIHRPEGHKATDRRPAIVFFFGGGWNSGSPEQFRHHCDYLASRGMVAIAADYRVASRHGVKPAQCVADAKSAIRWVRSNAKKLGIDPERIAAGGGSAGGHLAAATALVPGFDDPADDKSVSPVPNALVLFNPALVLSPIDGADGAHYNAAAERFGADPAELSPAHHIRAGAPPTIIFHGRADTTVPYSGMEWFAKRMKEAGNRCELIGYDGQGHGFFNHSRRGGSFFKETLTEADRFLASLKYVSGPPTLQP